jgi:succinate dehydrogenase / fumarate reductase cytochrome b subunit
VGIIPVGAFLCFHLFTNSYAFKGIEVYDKHVRTIYELPGLFFAELFLIWLPILFHAILGFYIMLKGRNNVLRYPYSENIFFVLQRLTGVVAFVFIIYHVITTRFKFNLPEASCFLSMQRELFDYRIIGKGESILVPGWKFYFYILGIISSSFHFGNGIWGFCVNFGILQGQRSQKVGRYIFLVLGLVIAIFGFVSLIGFHKSE